MRQGIDGTIATETFAVFIRVKSVFNDVAAGIRRCRRTLRDGELLGREAFYLRANPLGALSDEGVRLTGSEQGDAADGNQEDESAKHERIF